MSISDVVSEAHRDRKRWGNPAKIVVEHDDESVSLCCTDAVSGNRIIFTELSVVDSYEEVYLLAMGLDFTRTSYLLRGPRPAESVMQRSGVRPSVCPVCKLTVTRQRAASMRRGQRTFRPDNKDRHILVTS